MRALPDEVVKVCRLTRVGAAVAVVIDSDLAVLSALRPPRCAATTEAGSSSRTRLSPSMMFPEV